MQHEEMKSEYYNRPKDTKDGGHTYVRASRHSVVVMHLPLTLDTFFIDN